MQVFVLDKRKEPLMPCHPARARKLLRSGRARVHRRAPFTIRLTDREAASSQIQPVRLKVDPGAKTTGLALTREGEAGEQHVLWLAELHHRGEQVREALTRRRQYRRNRRSRKLRHRPPRFNNRRRAAGWLPPTARSRLGNVTTWADRLRRLVPVTAATVETVRFDTQAIQRPGVSGTDYQNGPLAGWEAWNYLLHRDRNRCVYCDATGVPLEQDHVVPKSRGGGDRVGNLVVSCRRCNQAKGAQSLSAFLANEQARLRRIRSKLNAPLDGAAAVNATRKALPAVLRERGLPVELTTGGRTRANRRRLGVPKTHALDAACAGEVGDLHSWNRPSLVITATGRGSYPRTRLNKHGFPRGYLVRRKQVAGFRTGDQVRAVVPSGQKAGVHTGRVAVRASGSFNIQTPTGTVQGINARYCTLVEKGSGYTYTINDGGAPSSPA
ncbi:MAG: RNA-guided endonuclease IscB [Halorhodospira sp.]